MNASFKAYFDVILVERSWSWTLVGILYLVVSLILRGFFMKPLVRAAKGLDRPIYQEIERAYSNHSLLGWIFFYIPLFIFIVLWYRQDIFPNTARDAFILLAVASFILSVLLHLKAFGLAAINILRETLDKVTGRNVPSLE